MEKTPCKGNFKPSFKSVKHMSKNPYYLSADPSIRAKENVTDEFITFDVKVQEGWVCMDCNKYDCLTFS